MSFYVSDSLKNIVTEESLVESDVKIKREKINFLGRLYAQIELNTEKIYCKIIDLKNSLSDKDNYKSEITIGLDDTIENNTFSKIVRVSMWNKFFIKLANNNNLSDIQICDINVNNIKMKQIQKSLTGYNYTFTIVIDNIISF